MRKSGAALAAAPAMRRGEALMNIQMTAKQKERSRRNAARLIGCTMHEFDWRCAIEKERARRRAIEERYCVSVGVRSVVWCRCKKCGGKVLVGFAIAYMEGVKAALAAAPSFHNQHEGS